MQYSPQLIQRIKDYYSTKHGEILSDDEAIRRLDAFAELYQVMGEAATASPGGGGAALT